MQDAWLIRFKEVVQLEIDEAGGKKADGYRAVATKTGLGYDYIYQIFTGKPIDKPKQPGPDAMTAIERVYGKGEMITATHAAALKGRELKPVDLIAAWPFERVDAERWLRLSEREKGAVEDAMLDALDRIETRRANSANGTSG